MNDKHLIKNSTREERQKRVNGAIVISMLDGGKEPSPKAMELYPKYIDGEMEIAEIQEKIIEMYKEV